MNLLKITNFSGIVAICLLAITLSVHAETNIYLGTLDDINHERSQLVIDDQVFVMALNFKVYNLKGKETNRYSLKRGQKITYSYKDGPKGGRSISSAHIRPAEYSIVSKEED